MTSGQEYTSFNASSSTFIIWTEQEILTATVSTFWETLERKNNYRISKHELPGIELKTPLETSTTEERYILKVRSKSQSPDYIRNGLPCSEMCISIYWGI